MLAATGKRRDLYVVLLLTALWWLFFWRTLPPTTAADQASLAQGDFSAQFYAFSAYQAERLTAGEVPLWNPYANAGHPFLADTQSAVFYPPRLLAIYLSNILGEWNYGALQLEAAAHYWLGSVLLYVFARRATGSALAALVAALTFTYSGFLTGYPILQLAVLESAVWLPLVLLGIFQATRRPENVGWACMMLAGVGLGLSVMAGHSQTNLFIIYVSLAYLAYRLLPLQTLRQFARRFVPATAVMGLTGAGLAAVQLIPGWEYLQHTTRTGMGFTDKAGGFPVQDVVQFLVPGIVSEWSPLYVGLAGLALAALAIWRGGRDARFWAVVVAAALALSFGGKTVIYQLVYHLLPGMRLFRGQERAAFVVAFGLSMLAGYGVLALREENKPRLAKRYVDALAGTATLIFVLAGVLFVAEQTGAAVEPGKVGAAVLAAVVAVMTLALFAWRFAASGRLGYWPVALLVLVVLDLFSVDMGQGFEPLPIRDRPYLPTLASTALEVGRTEPQPFRIDGSNLDGLPANYATMLGLADIEGISPLRLDDHEALMRLPEAQRWQLLGVRYVFATQETLPVASEILGDTWHDGKHIFLHRLQENYPMAWFDDAPPEDASITFEAYEPERIAVTYSAPADTTLVFSEHSYPGWQATIDGEPVSLARGEFGLRTVEAPTGRHTVEMVYRPTSYTVGASISIVTLIAVAAVALRPWWERRRTP
jgi:hypothetical protein